MRHGNALGLLMAGTTHLVLVTGTPATAQATRSIGDPWADSVFSFNPGSTPAFGYPDPNTTLGAPERFTGTGFGFPSVVSAFSPAFDADELFSIGEGGHLTVRFDEPIMDNPSNPFGVDLIVFGNGGLIDVQWPNGVAGNPVSMFGLDEMYISVSADGTAFIPLPGVFMEGLFPAQAYADTGPYDTTPGTVLTNFQRPVDPSLTVGDLSGLTLAQIVALYNGSGGGTPVDIAGSGLPWIQYVRIDVPDDGDIFTQLNVEIEAFATVPEPTTALLFGGSTLLLATRKKQRGK